MRKLPRGRWLRGALAAAVLAILVVGVALFSAGGAGAQSVPGGPLFAPARAASAAAPKAIGLMRSRPVTVDLPQLGVGRSAASALTLNLFDDVSLPAVLSRTEPTGSGGTAWIGSVAGDPLSLVSFLSSGGAVDGLVLAGGKEYRVQQVGGTSTVLEIDQSAYPRDRHPPPPVIPAGDAPRTAMSDDGSTIDVLVVYTADAAAGAGGTAGITTTIDQAIAVTNQAYAASAINQRLRLVGSAQVDYTENGDLGTALDDITSGAIPNVANLRNQYGADEVVLVAENGGSYCGIAWMMTNVSTSFAGHAFAVVARDCAVGNLSFAHEMGHNMGADHDWYVSGRINPSDRGAYPYSYGFVSIGATANGSWRTIMSYADQCQATFGGQGCQRLGYFSNPNVTVNGLPAGIVGSADNAQTLNRTAFTVANFRQSVVGQAATPTPTLAPTATSTPVPTATPRVTIQVTPGASNVVLTPIAGVNLALAAVPAGGSVSVGVDTVANPGTQLSSTSPSQPVKAIVVNLTVDGTVSHALLPQAAALSMDFTTADVPAEANPLALKLFLSSDGQTWVPLDTQVTAIGGGSYRATASVPHFSEVALAVPKWRLLAPSGPRNTRGW